MKDTIVRRLLERHHTISFDDSEIIREADEEDDAIGADEEYAELNNDDEEDSPEEEDFSEEPEEEEHDDSQAPVQGKPSSSSASHPSLPSMGDEEMPEEDPTPEEEPKGEKEPTEYENPLDNQYAVKFTLGDEISLTSIGTKNSDLKTGVIEGYDPEGFYKVKWSDESVTNGLTDIALAELVKNTNESKCVCGSETLVDEDGYVICDRCGRKIRESKEDPLMLADKSRPKGKRMIRSEAHPVSTAIKPSIAEAIRNALKGSSLNEYDDPEEEEIEDDDTFSRLSELDNEFWTRSNEMQADIEELGYSVDEITAEYVVVSSDDDDEDNAYLIPIVGTSRTMKLDFSKAQMI